MHVLKTEGLSTTVYEVKHSHIMVCIDPSKVVGVTRIEPETAKSQSLP